MKADGRWRTAGSFRGLAERRARRTRRWRSTGSISMPRRATIFSGMIFSENYSRKNLINI